MFPAKSTVTAFKLNQKFIFFFCICVQVDAATLQSEFIKLIAKVLVRPELRFCKTVAQLARKMHASSFDQEDLPNILKVLDWLLSIPLSNAGTFYFPGVKPYSTITRVI